MNNFKLGINVLGDSNPFALKLDNPELLEILKKKIQPQESIESLKNIRANSLKATGYAPDQQSIGEQLRETEQALQDSDLLNPIYSKELQQSAQETIGKGIDETVPFGKLAIGAAAGGIGDTLANIFDETRNRTFDAGNYLDTAIKEIKAEKRKPYDTALDILSKARQERKDDLGFASTVLKEAKEKPLVDKILEYANKTGIAQIGADARVDAADIAAKTKKEVAGVGNQDLTGQQDAIANSVLDLLDSDNWTTSAEEFLNEKPEEVKNWIAKALTAGVIPSSLKFNKKSGAMEGNAVRTKPDTWQKSITDKTVQEVFDRLYNSRINKSATKSNQPTTTEAAPQSEVPAGYVKMIRPDGKPVAIPEENVEAAKAKKYKLVE